MVWDSQFQPNFKISAKYHNFDLISQYQPKKYHNFDQKIILAGGEIILTGGEIQKKNQKRNLINRDTNREPQIWK